MTWQFPLILNIIFGTIRSFLDKKLVTRIDPIVVYFYVVFWVFIYLCIYYVFYLKTFPTIYTEMILMGVLYAIAVGSYMKAIKINLSQSVVFSSYYLVIPMILSAFFLDEWSFFDPQFFSGQKTILGLILAFLSMFLILRSHSKKVEKMELVWMSLIILNIVLNGIGTYWGKTFVNIHTSLETIFSQCLGGLPAALIINHIRGKRYSLTPSNHIWVAFDGLIATLAVVFYYQAVKLGPLTLVLPIQTLLVTIAIVLVGLFIFKEAQSFDREKLIGLILGISGVVILMI